MTNWLTDVEAVLWLWSTWIGDCVVVMAACLLLAVVGASFAHVQALSVADARVLLEEEIRKLTTKLAVL